ncbi:hypothetical protein MTR67_048168 [Solanum verrucosum]|uniref:Gag-pol polyprotein n=1 Tax=Solanum verrucosum TaxID=315347 RepID=A0AAF0ZYX8_SOLVR|nr:hypothetical protein MTR67_048168 [Solanum verrucosum]
MNPLDFLRSQTSEDPQNFIDEVQKIFEVMLVTKNDRVELASYQLEDVANIWYILSGRRTWLQMQLLFLGISLVRPFWIGFSQGS